MAIGITYNNPGDLTVFGPGSFLYGGQSGVYSSPNGLYYAEFPTAGAGTSALEQYIQDNVGSDPSTSITTPSEFASYFLNGSYGPLQSTANNPYPQGWLSRFLSATGLSADSSLSGVSPAVIAQGVAAGEGTRSVLNTGSQAVAQTGGAFSTGLQTLFTDPGLFFSTLGGVTSAGAQEIATNPGAAAGIYGGAVTGGASAIGGAAGSFFAPLIAWLNQAEQTFVGWEHNTFPNVVERTAIGLVAIVLIIAAVFFLAGGPKIIEKVAPAALAA